VVAFFLRMLLGVQRVMEAVTVFFLEVLVNVFIEREGRNDDFLGLELRVKFLDGGDDFLDLRVAGTRERPRRLLRRLRGAPDSTMTMASSVPAMMIFIKLFFWSRRWD